MRVCTLTAKTAKLCKVATKFDSKEQGERSYAQVSENNTFMGNHLGVQSSRTTQQLSKEAQDLPVFSLT